MEIYFGSQFQRFPCSAGWRDEASWKCGVGRESYSPQDSQELEKEEGRDRVQGARLNTTSKSMLQGPTSSSHANLLTAFSALNSSIDSSIKKVSTL